MYVEIAGLRVGGRDRPLVITSFDDSGVSYESSDLTIPNRAGTYLGRDRQTERTLTFTINTGGGIKNLSAAQHLADELTKVWTDSAAKKPGELTEMVIETSPDRRRRIFGRCGKITAVNPDVRAMQGSVELQAEFRWTDPIAYSEEDTTYSISVVPAAEGGIKSPIIAPIKTVTWGGVGWRFVTNSGDRASAMAIKLYGPCKNPQIGVNGKTVGLKHTLAYDEVITVNGKTGTVTNAAGANVSRYLTSRSRLDTLKLDPGTHEVSFTAEDTTQTARAEILYADAYSNY